MKQKIIGFHTDEDNHWVADLKCGHKQHVRHDPPFHKREWVMIPEKREHRKGTVLNCKLCDEFGDAVANAILAASVRSLQDVKIDSIAAGMCKEGQIELALDRLKNIDLKKISQDAIATAIAL